MLVTNNFFVFKQKHSDSNFQVSLIESEFILKWKQNNDIYLKLLKGEYSTFKEKLNFKHKYGKDFKDILGTGYPSLYLISDRLKSLFEENKITGYKCYTIGILKKDGAEYSGYWGFSVTGRCGLLKFDSNNSIVKKLFNDCEIKYLKGNIIRQ